MTALEATEQELTQQVPSLLEAMNRMSSEVNALERQVGESQERYRKLLEQWSRLYEELRAQHGAAIDRVRPYFDAAQVLNAASRRVQGVVREFSAANSLHAQAKLELRSIEEDLAYGAHKVRLDRDQQDGLSKATVRVLKCQQDRDRREQEYARALREYQEAQESLDAWRMQIGDAVIKRTLPSFRQLQKHQTTLANEQGRINTLTERAKHAKMVYHNSMKELDRINVAVHTARRDHQATAGACSEDCPPPGPPPEEAPEVLPGAEERLEAEGEEENKEDIDDGAEDEAPEVSRVGEEQVQAEEEETACSASPLDPAKQSKQEAEEEEYHDALAEREEGMEKDTAKESEIMRPEEEEEEEEEAEDPELHKASGGETRQEEAEGEASSEEAAVALPQGAAKQLAAEAPETAVEVAPECSPEACLGGP